MSALIERVQEVALFVSTLEVFSTREPMAYCRLSAVKHPADRVERA